MAIFLLAQDSIVTEIRRGFEYEDQNNQVSLRSRFGLTPTDTDKEVYIVQDSNTQALMIINQGAHGKSLSLVNGNIVLSDHSIALDFNEASELDKIRATYLELYDRLLDKVWIGQALSVNMRSVSENSVDAVRVWFSHCTQAASQVARMEVGAAWTSEKRRDFLIAYHALVDVVRIWYFVMVGDAAKRDAWRNFSTLSGSPVYIDFAESNGDVRQVDGIQNIILTGASFGSSFDPESY